MSKDAGPGPPHEELWVIASILHNRTIQYISNDKKTRDRLVELNHTLLRASPKARLAIDTILGGRWIAGGERFGKYDQDIPLFPIYAQWQVIDMEERPGPMGSKILVAALLSGRASRGEQDSTVKVVLFRDRSLSQGYAIRVPPQVNTVQEAIAAHYGFSSKKFRGFTKEV